MNMRNIVASALAPLALAMAAPAQAQNLPEWAHCEDVWAAALTNLWVDENGGGIKSFAEGRVMIFRIDTEEPAVFPGGMVVLVRPSGDEGLPPAPNCYAAHGYTGVDVDAATATYDAARGLEVTIPAQMMNLNSNEVENRPVRLLIGIAAGSLEALN